VVTSVGEVGTFLLYRSAIKFPQDVAYQKLLKLVDLSPSYSKK